MELMEQERYFMFFLDPFIIFKFRSFNTVLASDMVFQVKFAFKSSIKLI
jgi:hypothetical protein